MVIEFIKKLISSPKDAIKELWSTFISMLSEKGDVSHKRWISVSMSAAATFSLVYVTIHFKDLILPMYKYTLVFILLMSGVATVPQIISLWKGRNIQDGPVTEETKTTVE